MTALLRVKRKLSTEPTDALVVASKRARNDTEVETIFKFVGTLKKNEDHNDQRLEALIRKHRAHRAQWGKNPKIRNTDFRAANRNYSEKRLKLMNIHRNIPNDIDKENDTEITDSASSACSGSLDVKTSNNDEINNMYHLYEVYEDEENQEEIRPQEKSDDLITCNGVPLLNQKIDFHSEESEFVYDIYYSTDTEFDPLAVGNVVSIKSCTLENDLILPEGEDESDCFDDDDDSNDENNWRNDYPEEDPQFERNLDYYRDYDCIDEDELLDRITNCDIASDEICSDDDEFHDTNDHNYARYKTRVLETLKDDDDDIH